MSKDRQTEVQQIDTLQKNEEDEAEILRQALLSKMKDKTSFKPKNDEITNIETVEESNSTINEKVKLSLNCDIDLQPSMKISISSNGDRNVRVGSETVKHAPHMTNQHPKTTDLIHKENKLSSIRKDVTNNLYKLSAQLSQ